MSVTPQRRCALRENAADADWQYPGEWDLWYSIDVPDLLDALDEAERRAETAERRLAAHSAPVEEAIEE